MPMLRPTDEMKESGISYIENIPDDWIVRRGKTILSVLDRPVKEDDGVVTCFRDGEVTLRTNRRVEGFTNADKEIGYQGVEPGDLVVHGMDGFAGSIGISDSRGKMSPIIIVLDSVENKKYLMYYLRAMAFREVFLAFSTGIRIRSCDLRWNKLAVFPFLVPKKEEQQAIADYLDDRCSKIDEIIAEATASIEEYKELKQAVIFEAVTKGLDKTVPMKDSGIEWIGEIPVHWAVKKFKYVASVNANLVSPDNYMDYQQIAPDCIEKDTGRLIKERTVSEAGVESWNQLFRRGQLIYSKIRPILNKVIIAPYDGLCSADMYPLNVVENVEFVQKAMLSRYFVEQVGLITQDRVKMPKINKEELANIFMVIPPCNEQEKIVSYLNVRMMEIDKIVDEKQALIEDLQAYKKSLIYEVVTGKRRVV